MMNNKIGVLIGYGPETDLDKELKKAIDMGLESCQLCIWNESVYTDEHADHINEAAARNNLQISALWAGWAGPCEWNFIYGPSTIGLVPAAYRETRVATLKKAADFAEKIHVSNVVTHVGFIPENPDNADYFGTVGALRSICGYMKRKNINFLFETGQETPVTMLRTIEAIGMDNVGINFDTANLILYGKANPVDALDVFGKYVKETHIKDGFYPTNGMELGNECAVGQGKANFPAIIRKLEELGYTGAFTIEREISGDQQIKDIISARDLLREWMK